MTLAMSILEGEVTADKISRLETNFAEGIKVLDPGVIRMFLIKNGTKCKIITLWDNKEAVTAMKIKGTPKGVLMFRHAGVEPTALVYEVVNSKDR